EARFAGQVPAQVLRRAAAAAGDRAGPGAGARVCCVRRARLGAARVGAGPGDQPSGRPAEVAASDLSVYFARPERGAAPEPLGGRDVPGACGGNRHARRDLQHAAAPVYTRLDGGGAALFASQSGPGQGHAAVGRDSQPAVAAVGLRFSDALPQRAGGLRRDAAGSPAFQRQPRRGVSFCLVNFPREQGMTHPTNETYDLVLAGGLVVDGTNSKPFVADIGVRGDRIAAVGDLSRAVAAHRADVWGMAVSPGFIDSHTHDDNLLLRTPAMEPKISQGVTTVVTGNCGISLAPLLHDSPPAPLDLLDLGGSYAFSTFADYLGALRDSPPAVNCACMLGHSTLRAAIMPDLHRNATPQEIDRMQRLALEGMQAGAIGISTGTFYPPAANATTEEIIEVCRPLSAHNGIYATHMRDEGDHIVDALNETFRIGKTLDVPVVISHHKLMGRQNFGRSAETLAIISEAMKNQEISLDAYPYIAGSTMLKKDRALLSARTIITWCKPFPQYTGKD